MNNPVQHVDLLPRVKSMMYLHQVVFGDQLGHLADEVDVLVDGAGHLLELGVVGHKVADVGDALDLLLPLNVLLGHNSIGFLIAQNRQNLAGQNPTVS